MKKILTTLMIAIIFISSLNAFWWDPPEKKAQKLVLKIEKYASQCNDYEDLTRLGWNWRYRKLSNKIIQLGSHSVNPLLAVVENKKSDWKYSYLCINLVVFIQNIEEEDATKIITSFLTILEDTNHPKEARKAVAESFYWIGARSAEIEGVELPTKHWISLLSKDERSQIVEALLNLSLDTKEHTEIRCGAITSLCVFSDFGNSIIGKLIPLVKNANQIMEARIVDTVGGIGMSSEEEIVSKFLVDVLVDEKGRIASERALFWIRNLEIEEATPYIIESLQNGKYCSKAAAAELLGLFNARSAIPDLIKALKEDNHNCSISGNAAKSLGKLGAKEAVPALIELLRTSQTGTWAEAAIALAKLNAKEAISHIIDRFEELPFDEGLAISLLALDPENSIPLVEAKLQKTKYGKSLTGIRDALEKCKRGEKIELSE